MTNALTSALTTLQVETPATVRDVNRLFLDAAYREQLLSRIEETTVKEFWYEEFENFSTGQQQQVRDPIVYRMRVFYSNPYLYPIICHPDAIDFAALMQQNKIILVSLAMDEQRIPELERQLLGAMIVSQLQIAGMSGKLRSTAFYLYIDEVQKFITTSLDQVFSEAGKYRVSMTVANQYMGQLSGSTLDAIMGNTGATIAFRCGIEDARMLAPHMQPNFTVDDLVNLDQFQAVVKMQSGEFTQPAFSLSTQKPYSPEDAIQAEETEKRIRQLSIEQYTPRSCAEVMAWLNARYLSSPTPPTDASSIVSFYDEE